MPSDLPTHIQVIPSAGLKSQSQLNKSNEWTKIKKIQLNVKKTNNMIFHFSKKHHLTTNLNVNNTNIKNYHESALMTNVITDGFSELDLGHFL